MRAERVPGHGMEERWPSGGARHGCTLVAETFRETRNECPDRAPAAPAPYAAGAAFFGAARAVRPPGRAAQPAARTGNSLYPGISNSWEPALSG